MKQFPKAPSTSAAQQDVLARHQAKQAGPSHASSFRSSGGQGPGPSTADKEYEAFQDKPQDELSLATSTHSQHSSLGAPSDGTLSTTHDALHPPVTSSARSLATIHAGTTSATASAPPQQATSPRAIERLAQVVEHLRASLPQSTGSDSPVSHSLESSSEVKREASSSFSPRSAFAISLFYDTDRFYADDYTHRITGERCKLPPRNKASHIVDLEAKVASMYETLPDFYKMICTFADIGPEVRLMVQRQEVSEREIAHLDEGALRIVCGQADIGWPLTNSIEELGVERILLAWAANERGLSFDSKKEEAQSSDLSRLPREEGTTKLLLHFLNDRMPTLRREWEGSDLGAILGLIYRAHMKARSFAEPTFHAAAYAERAIAEVNELADSLFVRMNAEHPPSTYFAYCLGDALENNRDSERSRSAAARDMVKEQLTLKISPLAQESEVRVATQALRHFEFAAGKAVAQLVQLCAQGPDSEILIGVAFDLLLSGRQRLLQRFPTVFEAEPLQSGEEINFSRRAFVSHVLTNPSPASDSSSKPFFDMLKDSFACAMSLVSGPVQKTSSPSEGLNASTLGSSRSVLRDISY